MRFGGVPSGHICKTGHGYPESRNFLTEKRRFRHHEEATAGILYGFKGVSHSGKIKQNIYAAGTVDRLRFCQPVDFPEL